MKKIIYILICITLILGTVGCKNKDDSVSSFVGTIKEINNNSIIVEPFDDFEEKKTSDKFKIEKLDDTEFRIGEIVKIVYSGEIKEVYPAEINATKIFSVDLGDLNVKDKSDIKIADDKISFTINDNSLSADGATFILKNNSKKKIRYGAPYSIEVKIDDEWYRIDTDLTFIMPVYYLEAGESKEIKIEWKNGYGSLPTGSYRLIKNINYDKTNEALYVGAEFTIN